MLLCIFLFFFICNYCFHLFLSLVFFCGVWAVSASNRRRRRRRRRKEECRMVLLFGEARENKDNPDCGQWCIYFLLCSFTHLHQLSLCVLLCSAGFYCHSTPQMGNEGDSSWGPSAGAPSYLGGITCRSLLGLDNCIPRQGEFKIQQVGLWWKATYPPLPGFTYPIHQSAESTLLLFCRQSHQHTTHKHTKEQAHKKYKALHIYLFLFFFVFFFKITTIKVILFFFKKIIIKRIWNLIIKKL